MEWMEVGIREGIGIRVFFRMDRFYLDFRWGIWDFYFRGLEDINSSNFYSDRGFFYSKAYFYR